MTYKLHEHKVIFNLFRQSSDSQLNYSEEPCQLKISLEPISFFEELFKAEKFISKNINISLIQNCNKFWFFVNTYKTRVITWLITWIWASIELTWLVTQLVLLLVPEFLEFDFMTRLRTRHCTTRLINDCWVVTPIRRSLIFTIWPL